jgi:hypothetical protein
VSDVVVLCRPRRHPLESSSLRKQGTMAEVQMTLLMFAGVIDIGQRP